MMHYWSTFGSKNRRTGFKMRQSLDKRVELLRQELQDIVDVADLIDGNKWYAVIAREALTRDSDRLKLEHDATGAGIVVNSL